MNKKSFNTKCLTKVELKEHLKNPTLFQHPSWLNAIEEGLGYRYFGLLTYCGGTPVVLGIFFECKKGGLFKLAGSPLPGSFTPYMEPVWLEDNQDNDVKAKTILNQHQFLKKKGFFYIEQRFRTDGLIEKLKQQDGLNYEISFPETFILKIEPDIDTMWKKMEGRSRNMVRKAEKLGVKLCRSKGSMDEIELFYEMLKHVFAKSGKLPPHPLRLYKSIAKYLIPEKRFLMLSAKIEGKVIAMGIFIYDSEEMHFLSGASLPEAYKTGANNLIQWYAIKFAVENGIKEYDLGGKGIPSIDKFKASFGGEVHRYGRVVLRSKTAFIAERLYRKFILFRDKLKTKIKA